MNKFSKSLYYPSIDIDNEIWLKSAILFWDEINTIVPESISMPYKNYSTQYLHDVGILMPIYVNPSDRYVSGVVREAMNVLDTTIGKKCVYSRQSPTDPDTSIFPYIHEDKLHIFLRCRLKELKILEPSDNGYYKVFDKRLLNIYMTLLANRISEDKALALVTDNSLNFQLSERTRYAEDDILRSDIHHYRDQEVILKQGMLTNLVIDNIIISENTTLSDIVSFRQKYRDELARFRINLAKLADSIQCTGSLEALQQNIQTTYHDEFIPAYDDLKAALKSSKIKWITNHAAKFCAFSISTVALPVILGLGFPQALFVSAGISAVASTVTYNVEKQDMLRNNPYTYFLNINKEL